MATDVPADLADLRYLFDCDNNGAYEVGPQVLNAADCPFYDDSIHTIRVKVVDGDGGEDTDAVTVNVNNLPPVIDSIAANPQTGEAPLDSTITVIATDLGSGDIPDLLYYFDCDNNLAYEVGPQAGNSGDCSFTTADLGTNTVNVKVEDQDGGVATSSTLVTVTRSLTDWTASMSVSGQINPIVPGGITLVFGVKPGATSGFDQAFDSLAPPPPFSPPFIEPHFFYSGNLRTPIDLRKLQLSVIESGDLLEWPLRVDAEDIEGTVMHITLQWDISGIPLVYQNVGLFTKDGQFLVDMKSTSDYQFDMVMDDRDSARADFIVRVSRLATQVLDFKAGWNLVSLFVQPVNAATAVVLQDIGNFNIFTWSGDAQGYLVPTTMQTRVGYWVAVFADASQTVQGSPLTSYTVDIPPGWSMLGSINVPGQVELLSGGGIGLSLFGWNATAQGYVPTTTLVPGFGYWLPAFADAQIRISPL